MLNKIISLLIALLFSGCKGPGESSGWVQVAESADFINTKDIRRLVVSQDQQWAYVLGDDNKQLVAIQVGGQADFASNIASKDKWHKIGSADWC